MGLEMPYSRWLTRELQGRPPGVLRSRSPGRDTGLFRPEAVGTLVDDHLSLRHDHGRPLWALLNFMMWHELYLG